MIGLYEKSKSFGFVRPDNQRFLKDIYIPAGKEKGAMTGHKVVVELTSYGGENMKPEGKVVEIIGHINDPGTDIMSIVMGYDMPVEFPEKVLNQAERVGKDVSEADMAGRMDLRDWQMVTIDGEDARYLDDARLSDQSGEWMETWCTHCGRDKLCTGKKCIGSGGIKARNKCVSGRSCDSYAAA